MQVESDDAEHVSQLVPVQESQDFPSRDITVPDGQVATH
jgi:hypothetical protein